jgi:hypothetical protein
MKSRLLSATLIIVLALIVGACDSGTNTAQPTATPGLQPTAPAQGNATAAPATAAATTGTISGTTVPTATQATTVSVRGPLTLSPVTVETTDATHKGVFATDRTLNMPQGFHIGVYALVNGVRWLEKTPQGTVYATSPSAGKVYMLPVPTKMGSLTKSRCSLTTCPACTVSHSTMTRFSWQPKPT